MVEIGLTKPSNVHDNPNGTLVPGHSNTPFPLGELWDFLCRLESIQGRDETYESNEEESSMKTFHQARNWGLTGWGAARNRCGTTTHTIPHN